MAKTKSTKETMTRRGVTYKIERDPNGTIKRFIRTGTGNVKDVSTKGKAKGKESKANA